MPKRVSTYIFDQYWPNDMCYQGGGLTLGLLAAQLPVFNKPGKLNYWPRATHGNKHQNYNHNNEEDDDDDDDVLINDS